MIFHKKRKEALQALGDMAAIATDYICKEADIRKFNEDIAIIADHLKDSSGYKVLDIAIKIYSERHAANNSSSIVGGKSND